MTKTSFYPHRPQRVELRETPISWVFIAGDLVYKVKKPIVLPFLDYGTLERRRAMCHEEVRLNRRLTSGVYRGVRAIVRENGDLVLAEADRRDALEWAVEMRRLREDRTLSRLLESGQLDPPTVRDVGRRLASFHARAEPAPAERASLPAVKRRFDDEFGTLLEFMGALPERRELVAAERFAQAFLAGRREMLLERARAGRVREGHGDLRLEHVVLEDGVQVFDCVEFDAGLRELDVAADLAFTVMELAFHGADDLWRELVRAYREAGGDPGDDSLLAFYAAYRALVRAKLAYMRAEGGALGDSVREEALAEAARMVALAKRFRWRARLPLVLVVCGVTASGKTVLARTLADASGLPELASDPVRKELAGIAPTERAATEHYGDAFSRHTYRELANLAAVEVRRAGGAIVDATFRRPEDRRAFAERLPADPARIVFCECRAPAAVLAERATAREEQVERVSDATPALVAAQLREFAPLDEVDPSRHVLVRTDRDPAEVADDLEAQLDRRLSAWSEG